MFGFGVHSLIMFKVQGVEHVGKHRLAARVLGIEGLRLMPFEP